MRTLRQIPKVVGQTDAGETIYEARSARLILRGDAAHFNRLVRCSKCGREVPGRAVLGPADLEQPPQAIVCNDCVEAATERASRPGPLSEPAVRNDPAVVDAQAEMNQGLEELVEELGGPEGDGEAEELGGDEYEEPEAEEFGDELDEAPPAEEEAPAVNLQLMDDVASGDGDERPAPDDDELLMAEAALDGEDAATGPANGELSEAGEPPAAEAVELLEAGEPPAPEAYEPVMAAGGLFEDEPPAPEDDELIEAAEPPAPKDDELIGAGEPPAPRDDEPAMAAAGLMEDEPPAPEEDEPVPAGVERLPDQPPPPAPAQPDDDGLARRVQTLEDRLTDADPLDPLRLVALEETVHRLAERADAQHSLQVAIQARIDEVAGAAEGAQGKKESDKLRRRLDQMGERLEQLQATIDAEWVRAKSETATLAQTVADLDARVGRLAEEADAAAGADDERLEAVEGKVDEATARLTGALEAQRRELQDGLQKGLADVLSAIPPPPPAATDPDNRFRALERQLQQSRGEVAELNELHAALDTGLGALRGEIGDVRTSLSRVVDSKADLEDRLETFVRMSLVPEGDKGRKAKKAAESTLGTLSAAVQDLMREQRLLKESFATLEQAADAATAAAARASMQASSLGPVRSDVKLLHQEIAEQQEQLDALRRSVERLRQPPAAPPPPPTKAPAKKVPAAKAAPTAKRAAAKAAIVQAAARQAAATRAPGAAKRAARAKDA